MLLFCVLVMMVLRTKPRALHTEEGKHSICESLRQTLDKTLFLRQGLNKAPAGLELMTFFLLYLEC